jgi:hypothetical protein
MDLAGALYFACDLKEEVRWMLQERDSSLKKLGWQLFGFCCSL